MRVVDLQAGVAPLANGYMLLLTPIPNWDTHLRCLVIKSKPSDQDGESEALHCATHSVEDEGGETTGIDASIGLAGPESEPNSPRTKAKRQKHEHAHEVTADTETAEVRTLLSV